MVHGAGVTVPPILPLLAGDQGGSWLPHRPNPTGAGWSLPSRSTSWAITLALGLPALCFSAFLARHLLPPLPQGPGFQSCAPCHMGSGSLHPQARNQAGFC